MSIASEIERINTNIANAYTSIENKGGTLPQVQNSANLASAINTITGGGTNTGVYKVDSVAEMNEITDMVDGDFCIVKGSVPAEYLELKSISSDNYQYIDTRLSIPETDRIVMKCAFIASQNAIIFGVRNEISPYHTLAINQNLTTSGTLQCKYGTEWTTTTARYGIGEVMNIDFTYESGYQNLVINDVDIKTTNYTDDMSDTLGNNIYLFGWHYIGAYNNYQGSSIKMYRCQIYQDSLLIRDFVPAKRKSDNVIGLYDIANNVFYTNGSGSGTFTYELMSTEDPSQNSIIYEYVANTGWVIVGHL